MCHCRSFFSILLLILSTLFYLLGRLLGLKGLEYLRPHSRRKKISSWLTLQLLLCRCTCSPRALRCRPHPLYPFVKARHLERRRTARHDQVLRRRRRRVHPRLLLQPHGDVGRGGVPQPARERPRLAHHRSGAGGEPGRKARRQARRGDGGERRPGPRGGQDVLRARRHGGHGVPEPPARGGRGPIALLWTKRWGLPKTLGVAKDKMYTKLGSC